jgi:bifunctional DNase/RNase
VENDFKDLFGDWEPGRDRLSENSLDGEQENRSPRSLNEKEVKIIGVYEHTEEGKLDQKQTFVLLQDNKERKVPIWIGRFEAFNISMALDGDQVDRPFTYDLMKLMLDRLEATVERIIIDDLWRDTFYAKVTLSRNGESFEIDCRPSDALNIAVRSRAPIYMAESVIESVEQKF